MLKKEDKKLLIFWLIAIPLLLVWSFFWLSKDHRSPSRETTTSENSQLDEIRTAKDIFDYFSQKDGIERSFLVLFQNDMELRPSGGYLGSFGIFKIKDGSIISVETHDSNMFDERIQEDIRPPYPMGELLGIRRWGLRDSNWYPNFQDSAEKVEEFYYIGQGEEKFDGVIGLDTRVLSSILKITGPIRIEGFSQEFNSQNIVLELEYEVEKGYEEKGLSVPERKLLIGKMASALREKTENLSISEKLQLIKSLENDLNGKDIQLYFKDENLQDKISKMGWAGKVDSSWNKDYLMINEANLGGYKADLQMERKIEYEADLSGEKPIARLSISYANSANKKDWMTKDYQGFLRIYTPKESWLLNLDELPRIKFSEEYDKKVFGLINKVPLSQTVEYHFEYSLPERLQDGKYSLLLQKQSGMKPVPVDVTLIRKDGSTKEKNLLLDSDQTLEF